MPDLGERNELHEPIPPRVEDAIVRLQNFLDEIDRQGGEVLAVVALTALQKTIGHLPILNDPSHVQWIQEQKQVFIIKKPDIHA